MENTASKYTYLAHVTSGVIGLGPYTANAERDKSLNYMQSLVDKKIIQHNVVSFNMTFPEIRKGTASSKDKSYLYLGQISDSVAQNTTFVNSTSKNAFSPKLTDAFIEYGRDAVNMKTFGDYFLRTAAFDMQVDYLYVPSEDFTV